MEIIIGLCVFTTALGAWAGVWPALERALIDFARGDAP